jgi:hypothetical protein
VAEHSERDQDGPTEVHVGIWGAPGPDFYTNILQMVPGPFDVMLVFGREDGSMRAADGTGATQHEVARVAMSWAHAKSMIPLLAGMVATYEEQYGTIPAPGFEDLWKGGRG